MDFANLCGLFVGLPCPGRCTRKGLECTPQLRRRGRPRAENGFSCGGSSSPTSSQVNVSSEDASGLFEYDLHWLSLPGRSCD